ncbi:MAG: hypothetical protein HW413_1139 [Thermoleophilia bacterium]|nr:hypothetical protein [Thermoleophilia bacterium]
MTPGRAPFGALPEEGRESLSYFTTLIASRMAGMS